MTSKIREAAAMIVWEPGNFSLSYLTGNERLVILYNITFAVWQSSSKFSRLITRHDGKGLNG